LKIKIAQALSAFFHSSSQGFSDVYEGSVQIFNMIWTRRRELQSPEAQSLPARGLETMKMVNPKRGRHGIATVTSVEKALSSPLESKAVTQ
jgi:hypothetical protein